MSSNRQISLFLLASLCLSLVCYRDAFLGKALLAPLDIGPALFPHYRFMDPEASHVPDNHHIIDQFTYDLPLQKVIYDAYHSGEIPWWDPWTYGGRPLLADAHVNGTDPIRLVCYALLPFELAYNWNFILRGLLTGLGMFILLRYFHSAFFPSIVLALTYQFAGWFTVFWGHPWIQGSFVYYPFLWLIWHRASLDPGVRSGLHLSVGGLLAALVFFAGNLQSHVYLPLFAACHLAAVWITARTAFFRALGLVAGSGILGAMLAAPVLVPQVEFYLLGTRTSDSGPYSPTLLAGLLGPFLSLHPWPGGDFKTLGFARELLKSDGFALFAGGATGLFFFLAFCSRRAWRETSFLTAILLVALYLVIIITPVKSILYTRIAPLAGMGVILLASGVWAHLQIPRPLQSFLRPMAFLLPVGLLVWAVVVPWKLPALIPRLSGRADHTAIAESGGSTLALRQNQIKVAPERITLRNPAALCGAAALGLALFASAWPASPRAPRLRDAAAAFGLASTVIFHNQFAPRHDVALWNNLLRGGPAQREIMAKVAPGMRIDESYANFYDQVFPNAFPAFYKIHAVHGYSALQPPSFFRPPPDLPPAPPDWRADYSRETQKPFFQTPGTSPARFRDRKTGRGLPVASLEESHNRLSARFQHPVESALRTDTRFPGWTAEQAVQSSPPEPDLRTYSLLRLSQPADILSCSYEPSFQTPAVTAAITALVLAFGLAILPLSRPA